MSAPSSAKLYTPQLLSLATQLAHYPLTGELPLQSEARSKTCGSSISLELAIGDDGNVSGIGMRVSACAIGQASSAIMAADIVGRSSAEITVALSAIELWLGGAPPPKWPELGTLAPAKEHHGRHGAILLPWQAAARALSLESEPS